MKESDKELLKLAAKACGFGSESGGTCWTESEYPRNSGKNGALWNYIGHMDTAELWNPLNDDGDALRLAVKLEMNIFTSPTDAIAEFSSHISEHVNAYDGSATRRAIVRAAAEIGKAMP